MFKSLGQNITGVISRPDSNSLDKFKSTFDIDHIFLNAEDALEKKVTGMQSLFVARKNSHFHLSMRSQKVESLSLLKNQYLLI